MGKHSSKGISFLGVSRKGKGKDNKTEMTPQHTQENKRAPDSTIGIHNELFCLFDFYACIDFLCSTFVSLFTTFLMTASISMGM